MGLLPAIALLSISVQAAPAVFAGRRAQELRHSLISDPQFMYAMVKSYADAGNVKVAEMTLRILRQEKPSEHGTDDWHDAINFTRRNQDEHVKYGHNS